MTEPFWRPADDASMSEWARFAEQLASETERTGLSDPQTLHRFSVDAPETFWTAWLRASGVPWDGSSEPALRIEDPTRPVETARFFPNLRLSWPEAMLRRIAPDDDDWAALVGLTESGASHRWTRGEVRDRAARVAGALHDHGIDETSRVAAVVTHRADAVVAALGTTSVGASWSSVAPDLGSDAILDRLRPLRPAVLFAHGQMTHQGRTTSLAPLLESVVRSIDSIRLVVLLDDAVPPLLSVEVIGWDAWTATATPRSPVRVPFDHPLFILFSSGTTGPPKCIVHGHGGTTLEHLKELRLHSDVRQRDRVYYQTTTAWMMWNWVVSALGCGAAVITYDGAIAWPEKDAALRHVATARPTHFGTNPTYLQYLVDAAVPIPEMPELRVVLSTGSILFDAQYDAIAERFGPVAIHSISGGTDIIGCFVLGCPIAPIERGESPCLSLGYDVRVQEQDGRTERTGRGELVCVSPFPSRPVALADDPDGHRFHATWFAETPGIWTHGDFIEITSRGSARMHGRSDGILNVRGIRIGPAEVYRVLDEVPEIRHALVVDQPWDRALGGRRLVLLVQLAEDRPLDRPLTLRIKKQLRDRASRNHVPDVIIAVKDLPRTHSGKQTERAVSDLLAGRAVRNRAALRNPEALDVLKTIPLLWPR